MKTKKTKQNAAGIVGATPCVLGATPLSNIPFHGGTRQQKRSAAQNDLKSVDTGVKQPATIKIVKFHKVPPRTEIVEKENAQHGSETAGIRFKERSKAEGAAAGLGEISASMWAKTSVSKGGAKDPAAAPIAKAASIMAERMHLEGDERATLLSSEGFKAYADEMVWGVRAPGEADDAPLDEDDPLQVRGRLREVWRSWRKLPVTEQRKWSDKQLAQDMAAALRRATGAGRPEAKGRRAAASVSTAEPASRSSKGKSKKSDGWGYVAAPKHASKDARPTEEAQQHQRPGSGNGTKGQTGKRAKKSSAVDSAGQQVQEEAAVDRQYDAVPVNETKLDEEYRRAEAMRTSKNALLAEMRSWEEEDEAEEAAAAAGLTVDQLRKQREQAEEAQEAAAQEENEAAVGGEDEDQEAAAGSSKAAASRSRKRKPSSAGHKQKTSGSRRSSRPSRRRQQQAESDGGDEMADASDDEEAAAVVEEAALEKVLADADDSDDDNDDAGEQPDEDEEKQQPPPSKKARRLPATAAAAPKSKPKADHGTHDSKKKISKRKDKSEQPAAAAATTQPTTKVGKKRRDSSEQPAAATAAKPTPKETREVQASSLKDEGNNRKRKAVKQQPAEEPEADEPGPSAAAAAASGGGRQRSKGSSKAAQSPARKSQRQQKEQDAQQPQTEEEAGPAVSGAGKSSGPRHGRPAGGAQAARIEALEKKLFSNTRRNSYGRADSPGLARTRSDALAAEAPKQRSSRLGKNKN